MFPKTFGGTDKDGRIILCNKCHIEIHKLLDLFGIKEKEQIIDFTTDWLKEDSKKVAPPCPRCKDLKIRMSVRTNHSNYLTLRCIECGYTEKNFSYFNTWWGKRLKEDLKAGEDGSIREI